MIIYTHRNNSQSVISQWCISYHRPMIYITVIWLIDIVSVGYRLQLALLSVISLCLTEWTLMCIFTFFVIYYLYYVFINIFYHWWCHTRHTRDMFLCKVVTCFRWPVTWPRLTSIMSELFLFSCGSQCSVYLSRMRPMSELAYWNSLSAWLKIMSAISQSHRTLSSYAFFIKPNLRFVNVTCSPFENLLFAIIMV